MIKRFLLLGGMACILGLFAMLACTEENVTNPTTVVQETTLVTSVETLVVTDTIVVTDTVAPELTGEWLRFSAYLASVTFIKAEYPERAEDRFSSTGEYCNYGSAPAGAGRAGFSFVEVSDSVYETAGYTFEWVFGALGWVWGALQNAPTENVYAWQCTLRYDGDGEWSLLNSNLASAGPYIRDTRHD